MCLKILTILFVILAGVLSVQLLTLISGVNKKLSPMGASDYFSWISAVMLLYVTCAISLVFYVPGIYSKVIMLFFGIIPFVIGNLSNYKYLKLYTVFQLLCVIISGIYVMVL